MMAITTNSSINVNPISIREPRISRSLFIFDPVFFKPVTEAVAANRFRLQVTEYPTQFCRLGMAQAEERVCARGADVRRGNYGGIRDVRPRIAGHVQSSVGLALQYPAQICGPGQRHGRVVGPHKLDRTADWINRRSRGDNK